MMMASTMANVNVRFDHAAMRSPSELENSTCGGSPESPEPSEPPDRPRLPKRRVRSISLWLRLHGLHGAVQALGDRAGEDAVRLSVDGLKRGRALVHGQLAEQEHVVVEDELDLLVLDAAALHHAGAGMQLHAEAAGDLQLHVLAGLGVVTDENIDGIVTNQKAYLEGLQKYNDTRVGEAVRKAGEKALKEAEEKVEKIVAIEDK